MTPGGTSSALHGEPPRPPVQVLADRMAAGLTRREPGYPLPRRTALARRFQATPAQIDAAIDELVRRHLLRRLPTGEVHRAGLAEYLVSLDGLPGLSSFIDPMDHRVSAAAVRVSRLRAAADVAEVLGLVPGTEVCVRRCLWTADGEPAASRVIYVKERHADLLAGLEAVSPTGRFGGSEALAMALDTAGIVVRLGAVRIEIQPPVRSIARRLRLASGIPAIMITARLDAASPADFPPAARRAASEGRRARASRQEAAAEPDGNDPNVAGTDGTGPDGSDPNVACPDGAGPDGTGPDATGSGALQHAAADHDPVALTALALRPDLFRIVLDSAGPEG